MTAALALATWAAAASIGGCARPATTAAPTEPSAPPWIDAPLVGASPQEVDDLDRLATQGTMARAARLDRLLDLLDAARFAQDDDARETMWDALGGHPTGVGEHATRDATARLLDQALALDDDAKRAAQPEIEDFAADVISLLTTDLQAVGRADDLSLRTLVYRTLAESGHQRVADNARWRLFDHARGTLAAAVEFPAGERMTVAVQALYTEHESVEAWLADAAPNARPPWPSAADLWALTELHTAPLRSIERWLAVVDHRRDEDHSLADTVRTALPAPRSDAWPLVSMPAGTGRAESLAPIIRLAGGQLHTDDGRPHARAVVLDDGSMVEISRAVNQAVATDGRGTVLLVADPGGPAPQLRTALRGLARAQVSTVEVAVAEPRLAPHTGTVVTALPLAITRADATGASDQAWRQTRIAVQLSGRGPAFMVDGRWLSRRADTRQLRATVEALARAYPRERGVRLTLGEGVALAQLIELLAALHGGPSRPFAAVGWFADGALPPVVEGSGDELVERRGAMAWPGVEVEIEQPYPLHEDDQPQLRAFAEALRVCLPELAPKRSITSLAIDLRFADGRLTAATLPKGLRVGKAERGATTQCVEEQAYRLRLLHHREGLAVTATLTRAEPALVR